MVDEAKKMRESVRVNLVAAINEARAVMEISMDLGKAVAEIAAKHRATQSKMALACIMTGYSLFQFTLQPWEEVEPKFYEAVRLAKDMWEATRSTSKQEEEKEG